jgi:tetratricopeptide (TPR) repeat protein
MDAGKKLLQNKDAEHAILQFRNAAQATPKNPEIYYQLAVAYLTVGDAREGIRALRKTIELNPKHSLAQIRLSQLMLSTNDQSLSQEARKRLEGVLQDTPDNPNALHALALTDLQMGQFQEASQKLERALAGAPKELILSATLADAKLQQKDPKGAEAVLLKAIEDAPKSPEARVLLGRFYIFQQRIAEAEQQFQSALGLEPNHIQGLLSMATLQNASGRKAEAEQTFKKLSGLHDKNYEHAHAYFLFVNGKQDEAVKELEAIYNRDPQDRPTRTRLVAAYRAVNRIQDARKILDAALKKNSKDLDCLLQRAELTVAEGKYQDAEMDLNQVLHLKPDSAELHYALSRLQALRGSPLKQREELFEALRLNPFLLPVRMDLINLLLNMNAAQTALELADSAPESQRPKFLAVRNWALFALNDLKQMRAGIDQGLSTGKTADLLIQDGVWKLAQKDAVGARASLEEALKVNPTDVRALEALRLSYSMQQQSPAAVKRVKDYVSQQPNSAPAQHFLGMMLWANGDVPQARQAFLAAKAAEPRYRQADMSLIQMDVAEKHWDEAKRKLRELIAAEPNQIRAQHWLGELEEFQGNHQKALELFRKVIESEPQNADALNNAAYILSTFANQPDEALRYAQKAQELAPQDLDVADTLGWAFYQKGLYPSAVTHLERAASKEGGNVVWKYHLAMAYVKAGNPKRGRTVYEAALKHNPNVPEAALAKQVLDQAKGL